MKPKTLLILVLVMAAVCCGLYLIHPIAPLLLLLSVLIQAPIVWLVTRRSYSKSYIERQQAYRAQYTETGDAAAWLAAEQREAAGIGYKYWSRAGRALCALNQAQSLAALGLHEQALELAAGVDAKKLEQPDQKRLAAILDANN